MSQRKKKMMRRKMAQAFQHQMRCIELMIELGDIFGEFHTDYQQQFLAISQMCMTTLNFIRDIATKAWGYFPDDIKTWLK